MNKVEYNVPKVLAYLMYGLATLFLFYEMALQVSPSVLTKQLMSELHLDAAGLGVLGSVYFYSYTAMQIPAGLLFDRFSMRWLVTFAVFICVLGGASFTITHNVYIAGFGRFLLGTGSAFAFIAVLVVAVRCFPPRYFALLVGIAQMLAALGAFSGEAPFSTAFEHFGWRETMWGITFFGALLTLASWLIFRDINNPHASDAEAKLSAWQSLRQIMRAPQTWWCGLYAFANWGPITAFTSLWGVPYFMRVYGISSTKAAVAISMTWIGIAVGAPILGWLTDRLQRRNVLLSSCALIGLAAAITLIFASDISFSWMFVVLFLLGIGASGQILSFAVVRDNNTPEVMAAAIGFNNMAVVAGGAILQPLVGFLLRHYWDGLMQGGVPLYQVSHYQLALLVVPVCFLTCLVTSLFLIRETFCLSPNER